jgi:hypothetical protein
VIRFLFGLLLAIVVALLGLQLLALLVQWGLFLWGAFA